MAFISARGRNRPRGRLVSSGRSDDSLGGKVHTSRYAAVAAILAAGLIAGCGSSSKTTSSKSTTGAQPAAATVQSSSTAAGAGGAVPAALVTTKSDKLGTVLAYGPK